MHIRSKLYSIITDSNPIIHCISFSVIRASFIISCYYCALVIILCYYYWFRAFGVAELCYKESLVFMSDTFHICRRLSAVALVSVVGATRRTTSNNTARAVATRTGRGSFSSFRSRQLSYQGYPLSQYILSGAVPNGT